MCCFALAYKNHDIKKTDCNTAEGLVRWVLCVGSSLSRAVCRAGDFVLTTDGTLLCRPVAHQYYLLCNFLLSLHIYARLNIEPFVNRIALTML